MVDWADEVARRLAASGCIDLSVSLLHALSECLPGALFQIDLEEKAFSFCRKTS